MCHNPPSDIPPHVPSLSVGGKITDDKREIGEQLTGTHALRAMHYSAFNLSPFNSECQWELGFKVGFPEG